MKETNMETVEQSQKKVLHRSRFKNLVATNPPIDVI